MIKLKHIFSLVLVFSGAYLVKLVPISPVYITTVLGFVAMLLAKSQDPQAKLFSPLNLYILLFVVYLIPTQIISGADVNTFANVLVSLFIYIMLTYIGQPLKKEDVSRAAHLFVKFSIILLAAESIWRISHPQWILESGQVIATDDVSIYPFKISSIMFQDSNFVGIYTATMFFFCNYLLDVSRKRIRVYKIIFAALTILTLSRAAMIGILVIVFVRLLGRMYKRNAALLLFIGIPTLLAVLGYIITLVATDDSFMSKFFILEQAVDFFRHATIDQNLFGVGFANAKLYLGIGSHNILVTYLVDSGLIGLLFMLGIPIIYLISTRGKGWDIVLAFFFIGMSLAGHGVPFYYAQLATVYLLIHKNSSSNEI